MDACLATIEETLVLHHRGETVAPQKSALHWSDDLDTDEKLGRIMAMPAYVGGSIAHGRDEVDPERARRTRPAACRAGSASSSSPIPRPGLPVCFMDGTVVSAMRTGAVSGLAARALAGGSRAWSRSTARACRRGRSSPGSSGACLASPRSASYDPSRAQIGAFVARRAGRAPADRPRRRPARRRPAAPTSSCRRAWRPAPFIEADWFEPGMLLVSVSSHDPARRGRGGRPGRHGRLRARDLPPVAAAVARARGGRARASGDVVPLGAILAGDHPGRTSAEQRIVVSPGRPRHRGRRLGDGRLPPGARAWARRDASGSGRTRSGREAQGG